MAPARWTTEVSTEIKRSASASTAAVLALADLLISVDTSVVHLAGALGREAWVVLPFAPDWRWTLTNERSPWYPQVRLFRQCAPGDWPNVIATVRDALRA
jgi:ADP-heptose:LPS heptosyltransferase